MSYDLIIERLDGEVFDRRAVEEALARWPHFRRYDAESFRSAGTEMLLVADRPNQPVDNITMRISYQGLPEGFESACDVALDLAARLEGRVVDAQLGQTITPENRAASLAQAQKTAQWVRRLGTEFEAPAKPYVDTPAAASAGAAPRDDGGRPWWKFWARD